MAGSMAETWQLEDGNFFIHRIKMATYIKNMGWTQKTSRDGEVNGHRTLLTDGAADMERKTVLIEA